MLQGFHMEKLEMRARARAAARAAGLFELARSAERQREGEARGRLAPGRLRPVPRPIDAIDEAQARAACKPMGELEYIVNAADARGRMRTLYVIVPDLTVRAHYQQLGFDVVAGCRVLLDAKSLLPIAVLQLSERRGGGLPQRGEAPAGFNPYFEIPPT
jgi:hypothetical protein